MNNINTEMTATNLITVMASANTQDVVGCGIALTGLMGIKLTNKNDIFIPPFSQNYIHIPATRTSTCKLLKDLHS